MARSGDRMNRIRVLVADDCAVVRAGVRRFLEGHANCEVVAEATTSRQALEKAIETVPDVAVLEHSPPLLDGLEAARQIRLHSPATEVLLFTSKERDVLLRDALQVGVRGYVLKANPEHRLIEAVGYLDVSKRGTKSA